MTEGLDQERSTAQIATTNLSEPEPTSEADDTYQTTEAIENQMPTLKSTLLN